MFRDLDPNLRPWADWLYRVGEAYRLSPRITSTKRGHLEQTWLYLRYRAGLSRFPAARPGESAHQRGLAFDMVVSRGASSREQYWLGSVWSSVGGRWGGAADPVHFGV